MSENLYDTTDSATNQLSRSPQSAHVRSCTENVLYFFELNELPHQDKLRHSANIYQENNLTEGRKMPHKHHLYQYAHLVLQAVFDVVEIMFYSEVSPDKQQFLHR